MMPAGRNSGPAPSERNPWEATAVDEDELRRKLRAYALYAGNSPRLSGGRIVITRPISFSAPIYLDTAGLTLEAAGRFACTTRVQLDAVFEVRARHVAILGMYLDGVSSELEPLIFVRTSYTDIANVPLATRIEGCTLFGRRLYVDDCAGGAQNTRIVNNYQGSYLGTHAASIAEDGLRAVIVGNKVADGGSAGITVSANGGYAYIAGNSTRGSGIDTSAGLGSCTVLGNPDAGTIVIAAGDAAGLNT